MMLTTPRHSYSVSMPPVIICIVIEDLTPGYNRINDGSFQNDACRINNFSCRSADKQCCQQVKLIIFTVY